MFHNMSEKDWREFFQKESEYQANRIMDMVNADETLKDVHVPEELFDALMEKIREYDDEIDQAIYESEQEILSGAESKDAAIICFEEAKKRLRGD